MPNEFKGPGQWRTQAEKAQRGVARDPDEAVAAPSEPEAEKPPRGADEE